MDKMSSAESEDFPASAGMPGGQTSPLPPRPAPAGPHEGAQLQQRFPDLTP